MDQLKALTDFLSALEGRPDQGIDFTRKLVLYFIVKGCGNKTLQVILFSFLSSYTLGQ